MTNVTHPDTGTIHTVRNLRTDMVFGLECGKAGSRARMAPTNDDATCSKCVERTGGVAA